MSNTAVLDENGIATVAGDITVYHYDEETREYTSSSVEYLALGVGTPAHSCADAPPEAISGYVVCRTATLNGWEHVPDHRGETVYSTENGNPVLITQPGDYPADTTTKQPSYQPQTACWSQSDTRRNGKTERRAGLYRRAERTGYQHGT
ncbi:hypothetical protein MUW94_16885 [Escherichia coli]|nr:hypothetical protein [Escherichia coli]MCL9904056.1 hypothetical protein [Escherichia coli]